MRFFQKTTRYTFTALPKDGPSIEAEIRALLPERYLRRTAICVTPAGEAEVVELVFDMRHRVTEILAVIDRVRAAGVWMLVDWVDITPA